MKVVHKKPVRKCLGCGLNRGNQCGLFSDPAAKWKGRRCEGYNSPVYQAEYERLQHPEGARARRLERMRRAVSARSIDHHDGRHLPGSVR